MGLIAGVDEAGRGPLAGVVVAAAVILKQPMAGLQDSKTLSAKRREYLARQIKRDARAWAVAQASIEEIDQMNILQASLLAMRRALEQLAISPQLVLVDGKQQPAITTPCKAIVKGDSLVAEISAASILAKTHRDALMLCCHEQYPRYRFDLHKGYPTRIHMAALAEYGPCALHRRSYAPVRAWYEARATS